tara:strand:- start:244 stop:399 length:156 start_codon:yes stop_codon:yes gene_type:complete
MGFEEELEHLNSLFSCLFNVRNVWFQAINFLYVGFLNSLEALFEAFVGTSE